MTGQLRNKIYHHKWNIAGVFLIFVCTYAAGIQQLTLPGVYYDAVYPDYIAAVGAFPGIDNFTQITKHAGLPLLGNLYHGTLTAMVQFLVLKCTGTSNVYTLRMTNLFYIGIIGSILFLFTRKISRKTWIPLAGALVCVTAQSTLLFSRTQYYIMLPGVVFFLLSCCILSGRYCMDAYCPESKLLLAGIFQGIAFYAYFTFLFLAPASLLIIAVHEKRGRKLQGSFIYLWGILLGSILYFFAYYDSFLVNVLEITAITRVLLFVGSAAILLALGLPALVIVSSKFRPYRQKIVKIYLKTGICTAIPALAALVVFFCLSPGKLRSAASLFMQTAKRNTGEPLLLFWRLLYNLLTNDQLQDTIFGERLNDYGDIYWITCIVVTIVLCIMHYVNRKTQQTAPAEKMILHLYLYLFGFYLCSLPIVKGMQPQHFVVCCFMMFFVILSGLCRIYDLAPKRSGIIIAAALLAAGLAINCQNNHIFLDTLEKSGGRGRYSSAYNDFACEAKSDLAKGNKIYVFPEWGFYANFVYLTSNNCKAVRDADLDLKMLQNRLNSGDAIVFAANDDLLIDRLLQELSYNSFAKRTWLSKEGEQVFVSVEIH